MKNIVIKVEDGVYEIIEKWMPEKPISRLLGEYAENIARRCPSKEEYESGGMLVCDDCLDKCVKFYGKCKVADEVPEEFLTFLEYGNDEIGICQICGQECDAEKLNYIDEPDDDIDNVDDIF